MNVYYSVVPDKNYFIAEKNGYPSMDYDKLLSLMKENIRRFSIQMMPNTEEAVQ